MTKKLGGFGVIQPDTHTHTHTPPTITLAIRWNITNAQHLEDTTVAEITQESGN